MRRGEGDVVSIGFGVQRRPSRPSFLISLACCTARPFLSSFPQLQKCRRRARAAFSAIREPEFPQPSPANCTLRQHALSLSPLSLSTMSSICCHATNAKETSFTENDRLLFASFSPLLRLALQHVISPLKISAHCVYRAE